MVFHPSASVCEMATDKELVRADAAYLVKHNSFLQTEAIHGTVVTEKAIEAVCFTGDRFHIEVNSLKLFP